MLISSPSDIKTLVDRLYDKVNQDEILSPIFNEIMQVNWDAHLPIMYQFWGSLLLGEHSYTGNPMQKHIEISKIVPFGEKNLHVGWNYLTKTSTNISQDQKPKKPNCALPILPV